MKHRLLAHFEGVEQAEIQRGAQEAVVQGVRPFDHGVLEGPEPPEAVTQEILQGNQGVRAGHRPTEPVE